MTTRPYELLARFGNDGSIAGVSIRTITTLNGRDYEGDPTPLSGASDPAFTAFAEAFSAAAVAERDGLRIDKTSLETQVTTLTSERDLARDQLAAKVTAFDLLTDDHIAVTAERDQLTAHVEQLQSANASLAARVDELLSELDAIQNPPGPDLSTRDGVRQWVTDRRYDVETGGIYVGDQFISTGRDEVGHWFPRFYNALMWTQGEPRIRAVNPDGLYPFKPKGHPPTVLTAVQVMRVYEVMAWFINQCFAVEAELYARLDAGAALDVVIDATPSAWPSNRFDWQPPA